VDHVAEEAFAEGQEGEGIRTVRSVSAVRDALAACREARETIALVPTMGNLHRGHLRLVELARGNADRVVVSIFVNPTQFGPGEDFRSYPRTLAEDRASLAAAGADLLFAPPVDEIYPGGQERSTRVSVPDLSGILCGEFRPGHFDGVTTVVARLFNIVQPDVAVFGQKDYQQLVIIRRMAADLHFPLRILAVPTERDTDGLALSSRNQYLSPEERHRAPALYQALVACRDRLLAGARDFPGLEAAGTEALRMAGFRPDYFAIRRASDLALPDARSRRLVVLAAAHLGRARLIDNLTVDL
jgi:pantoate--beta-alanine ligase